MGFRANTHYVVIPDSVLAAAITLFSNWGVNIQTTLANVNTWSVVRYEGGGNWIRYRGAEIDKSTINLNNPRKTTVRSNGGEVFDDKDHFHTWYFQNWGVDEWNNWNNYEDDMNYDQQTLTTIVRP